jgi:hypothetical protein
MPARHTYIRRDRAPAGRPAKSGGYGLPPAAPMLRVQRIAGNRAAASVARRALQRLDEEDLAAIRQDRTQKKELERIQKKYNDNFETGEYRTYHGKETWDYWVTKAYSLVNLDKLITDLIESAARSKAQSSAPAKQPSQVPSTSSTGSSPNVSSPVPSSLPSSLPSSPGSAIPAPQKTKKKPKMVPFDASAVPAPPPKAWGPGMNPASSSAPAYKPQPVPVTVDAHNADVAGLIQHRPPGAVRVVYPGAIGADTIYFELTVTEVATTPPGFQQPLQRVWNLEIHYHPFPTTGNYLHVKMRAGTSAQNVLPDNNWLVDRAVFQAAVTEWDIQNPNRKAKHKW